MSFVICPECKIPMQLKEGKYGLFYTCENYPGCDMGVSAHADGRPMGNPTDGETRRFRNKAHEAFDKLWVSGKMKRTRAYQLLQRWMGLDKDKAHIGQFSKEQCKMLISRLE